MMDIPPHSAINKQSKMEVMELSDLHHPNCKINRKMNCGGDMGGVNDACRRESESSDSILLSPEASKATEAVEFIAEHLRNEDLYIQVNIYLKVNSKILLLSRNPRFFSIKKELGKTIN